MRSTTAGIPGDGPPRMAVLLPATGADELLRILLDAAPESIELMFLSKAPQKKPIPTSPADRYCIKCLQA